MITRDVTADHPIQGWAIEVHRGKSKDYLYAAHNPKVVSSNLTRATNF